MLFDEGRVVLFVFDVSIKGSGRIAERDSGVFFAAGQNRRLATARWRALRLAGTYD